MLLLNKEAVMAMHKEIIFSSGGSCEVRDIELLESALAAPNQSFDDDEFYPTVEEKAARLAYGLIKNHAFVDGNKRIGTVAMLVMLKLNNIEIKYSEDSLFNIIMNVADDRAGYEDIYEWIVVARDASK